MAEHDLPDPGFTPRSGILVGPQSLLLLETYEEAVEKIDGAEPHEFVEFLSFQDTPEKPGEMSQYRVRYRKDAIFGVHEVTDLMWQRRLEQLREAARQQQMMQGRGIAVPMPAPGSGPLG